MCAAASRTLRQSAAADGVGDDEFITQTLPGETAKVARNTHLDYALRPVQLVDFPLYFFIAGTSVLYGAAAKGYRFFRAKDDAALTAELSTATHPLHKSAVVTILTHKAWKIPILRGAHIPRREDNGLEHAVLVMLLLKPWRSLQRDLLLNDQGSRQEVLAAYDAWRQHVIAVAT